MANGDMVKKWRKEKLGWPQEAFAKKLGVSRQTAIRIEKTLHLTASDVEKIDKAFDTEEWRKDHAADPKPADKMVGQEQTSIVDKVSKSGDSEKLCAVIETLVRLNQPIGEVRTIDNTVIVARPQTGY